MMGSIKITRVNLKPLIPATALDIDTAKVLKRLEREVLKQLRSRITQETFSNRAKRALSKAIQIVVGPNSLTITTNHPAFKPLLEGQKAGAMTWLLKAKNPIPIITESGELIFRTATAKSMQDGSWQHPGRSPTNLVDKAKQEARKLITKRLETEIRKQLRKSMGHR